MTQTQHLQKGLILTLQECVNNIIPISSLFFALKPIILAVITLWHNFLSSILKTTGLGFEIKYLMSLAWSLPIPAAFN